MRTILVHVDHDEANDRRLEVAMQIARRHQAHLTLMLAAPVQQIISVYPYGGTYVAAEALAMVKDNALELERRLTEKLRSEDVAWDIITAEGEVAGSLAAAATFTELAIVGLPGRDREARQPPCMLAGDIALATNTPVLAIPHDVDNLDMDSPVLAAWNGSLEAVHALRAAIPLLRGGRPVTLLSVGEPDGLSAIDALHFLSRHDVKAEHRVAKRVGLKTEERIEKEAEALGAGLIVMGAFGRGRLRETIFGGVTHYLIGRGRFPLLLAH
jgi:nucleotide-binding universal stress UspA family protein